MVSKWWTPWMRPLPVAQRASIENLRRIESLGLFANFPRFKFNADTYGLSMPVTEQVDCEINRNV
ncbi:hypothetical protein [uncultured Bradyrhizobium sp.]|uniref:hypothetical protein n=1 Tax=uncultured Bradyrhizobium sp. TaxID=199684 RepID=UPI0035C9D17C